MTGKATRSNMYARWITRRIDAPKDVWMAIAVSLAHGTVNSDALPVEALMAEWQALYDNGIVAQQPRRREKR